MRVDVVHRILSAIDGAGVVNFNELARRAGVSKRTLLSYLPLLEERGLVVTSGRGRRGR